MNIIGTVTPKTDVSSLLTALIADASRRLQVEMKLDLDYLVQRYKAEGEKFTHTILPLLGKEVERSLIRECNVCIPQGFQLYGKSKLPKFMHKAFIRIYHEDGSLLPRERIDVVAVEVIRQVCLFFSKVSSVGCEEKWPAAIEGFCKRVTTTNGIKSHPALGYARKFLRLLFAELSPEYRAIQEFINEPWGRHGPGAVAQGERGNEKWSLQRVPGFPDKLYDINTRMTIPVTQNTVPLASRLICVPKDFRGPRIICAEPKECQFGQQGLKEVLYCYLENHYLTREHICFSDVTRNRKACFDQNLSTIDLKDASDRLSLAACRLLLPRHMFKLLTMYRSRLITTESETFKYTAFATMGSALCFPVQTMCFLAICKGVQWYWNNRMRRSQRVNPTIFVYGDDIIVDRALAPDVIAALEAIGLVVNESKTSTGTTVKESCGEWVVLDHSQVIVKPKSICVTSAKTYAAGRQTYQNLKDFGWFATAEVFADMLHAWLPVIPRRYNRSLQRMEYRYPALVERGVTGDLGPEAALYNYFTHIETSNILSKRARSTTPYLNGAHVCAKYRWQRENPAE